MDLTFIKCADLKKLDVRHYFKYIILQIFLLERTFQNSSILVVLISSTSKVFYCQNI